MSDKYDDIINLSRPESKYPRMPRANRAAQFSPFAALTGHEEAIRETASLMDTNNAQEIRLKLNQNYRNRHISRDDIL
mgnify:FL=1